MSGCLSAGDCLVVEDGRYSEASFFDEVTLNKIDFIRDSLRGSTSCGGQWSDLADAVTEHGGDSFGAKRWRADSAALRYECTSDIC